MVTSTNREGKSLLQDIRPQQRTKKKFCHGVVTSFLASEITQNSEPARVGLHRINSCNTVVILLLMTYLQQQILFSDTSLRLLSLAHNWLSTKSQPYTAQYVYTMLLIQTTLVTIMRAQLTLILQIFTVPDAFLRPLTCNPELTTATVLKSDSLPPKT